MRRPDARTGSLLPFLLRQLVWTALIGAQIGWLEAVGLERAGFLLARREWLELAAVYAVVGVVIGLPVAVASWLLARGLEALAGDSRAASLAARLAPALPAFAVAWVVLATRVNVLHLPDFFSATSLAGNAALALAFLAALLAFAHRPWRRSFDLGLALVLLAANLALAIASERSPEAPLAGSRPAPAPTDTRPVDVVLILIDTLRADHLGTYGYSRDTSPRIDALAAEGVVFERAYSTTNWTRPAVASLFTSTMPSRHNATALDRALSPDLPLLAEALRGAGYRTSFFTVGPNIEPADGYGRGVDHFFHGRTQKTVGRTVFFGAVVQRLVPGVGRLLPGSRHAQQSSLTGDPEELTNRTLEWVRQTDPEQPIFVYLHYLGPHSPYRPPPPFDRAFSDVGVVERVVDPPHAWSGEDALTPEDRQQMIDQYDGEILWHDEHIGRLLDGLRSAGRLDRAVVAITADHGEAFGEHGVWGHNSSLFEEVVRIPLVFWSSEGSVVPGRAKAPVSLLDVAPTLAELSGASVPEPFDGLSLAASLRNEPAGARTVFVENPLNDEIGLRSAEWSYFEGRTGEDFDRWLYRADDTLQLENLAETHPELVTELSEVAAKRREFDRDREVRSLTIELDDERRRMLEVLGYVEEEDPAAKEPAEGSP